jgi:hypothetical protein
MQAMCGQWGFKHLGWVMSCQGVVFQVPDARVLTRLKAYECLLRGKAGPKGCPEPDPRTGLVRGMLGSVHLEAMTLRQNMIAHVASGALLGQVCDDSFV